MISLLLVHIQPAAPQRLLHPLFKMIRLNQRDSLLVSEYDQPVALVQPEGFSGRLWNHNLPPISERYRSPKMLSDRSRSQWSMTDLPGRMKQRIDRYAIKPRQLIALIDVRKRLSGIT